jgi:hypothetical protein
MTSQPKTGAFYWFPSPGPDSPAWSIFAAHDLNLDPDLGHVELWPYVLTGLAAAWGKDADLLKRRLSLSYTGLPRGRVTHPGKIFWILHGNDAPISGWETMLVKRFGLSGQRFRFLFDEHERRIPGHPEALSVYLDYRSRSP